MLKKISKNFLYLFFSDALSHILGFIATVYIARLLEVEGFGKISYGLAFLSYALLLANPGLTTIGAREIARDHNNLKIIGKILGAGLFLALIIFLILLIGIMMVPGESNIKKIIFTYALSLFPFALLLEFVFQGREEMEYIGVGRFIQYGSYVILLLLLLKSRDRILSVPVSFFISYVCASGFLMVVFLKKYKTIKLSFSLENLHDLLKMALPVGLATLFYQLSLNLPPIVLGIFHTTIDVGNFSAGYKIIVFLLIIERVFYYLFFPIVSRQFAHTPEKLNGTFVLFSQLLFALTIPITAGGILLAPELIKIIYGGGYEQAIIILRILLLYFMIAPVNTIFGYGLVAIAQEKQFLKIVGITALLSFMLIIILGTITGGVGIGIGLSFSEFISIILMKKELSKLVKFEALRYVVKPIIAALIMAFVIILLHHIHFIVLVTLGIIIYGVIFYLLKGFSIKEFTNIRTIISQI